MYYNKTKGNVIISLLLLVAAVALGFFLGKSHNSTQLDNTQHSHEQKQTWFCSMHPQIKQDHPGLCPICNMELVPMPTDSSDTDSGSGEITFSASAAKLMDLQTTPVQRRAVETELRLTGNISYDETRLKNITAWTAGRIDRLYVDFTGTTVIKGDHMVRLYSPQLNTAIAEYLQAFAASNDTQSSDLLRNSARSTMDAAHEKLIQLGMGEDQIKTLPVSSQSWDYVVINSPEDGIVIEKKLKQGAYVKPGELIYTVADLNRLWVMLDAYETDLPWLYFGQQVSFSVAAYPGESFNGTISFISPVVDPAARTVKVRLNVDNSAAKLKPGMFVKAVVRSTTASNEKTMAPELLGKWICPMHPSVISDTNSRCDICDMPLVLAESLGYSVAAPDQLPLVIPATAPLITGKRAVVYVKSMKDGAPVYSGREIVLGPRTQQWYQVKDGLYEGELVVTSGNFKIDSALQIMARPSMMSPADDTTSDHMDMEMNMNMDSPATPTGQTLCPVMGGPINKEIFIEYKGKKVYFCCGGCDKLFLADPDKYIDKLPQFKQNKSDGMDMK